MPIPCCCMGSTHACAPLLPVSGELGIPLPKTHSMWGPPPEPQRVSMWATASPVSPMYSPGECVWVCRQDGAVAVRHAVILQSEHIQVDAGAPRLDALPAQEHPGGVCIALWSAVRRVCVCGGGQNGVAAGQHTPKHCTLGMQGCTLWLMQ